ncbi:BatA domain-containing protein [Lentisphaera marina]|uniref:BatA domain-containing protein n=1 Tax=Lentisphaera marina TaxID=1111041 RepID=UPI0023657450|nr:BatA domain-containing protein [Lentisphaera marina]MDD7986392.1 BatA domain-containing protein [Lentisphaera marina]
MQFIHTSLLFGLLAILIPILIHLFQKQKPKTVAIPTFHFIEQALIESSSSRKIKSSLLLFLRILLIALPVLLLAQPYVPGLNSQSEKKHVIIIDNSYYSAQGQQLQEAKAQALEIIKSLPEGSSLKLASVNNYQSDFTYIHDDIIEEINSLSPSNSLINFHQIIKRLDDKEQATRFHCISDLNSHAWKNEINTAANVSLYSIKKRRFNNYIQSIRYPDTFILDQSTSFEVNLTGDTPLAGLKVHLYENKELLQTRTIPLSNNNSMSLKFNYIPRKENFDLHFKLDIDDEFQDDNSFYFVGKSSPRKQLHIIDQAAKDQLSPGLVCQLALQENTYFDIQRIALHQLKPDADIYLFSGLNHLKAEDWNEVDTLSQMGKTIILWPMDDDDPQSLSPRILPIFNSNLYKISDISRLFSQHPKLKDFNNEFADITLPQSFLLDKSATHQNFLMSFDKQVLVSASHYRNSRLIFCGISMSPSLINSNFIAPLIHLLCESQDNSNPFNLTIGDSIQLDSNKALSIINPEGIKDDIAANEKFYNKTLSSGFYELSTGQTYALNLNRQDGINSYLEAGENRTLEEDKKSKGFHISSSLMSLVLLLLVLAVNLVELKLTRKENA